MVRETRNQRGWCGADGDKAKSLIDEGILAGVSAKHKPNCQRQTGSEFVINLLIEADRVEVTGEPHTVDVPRDDGSTQRIYRCPRCQIAVFSEYTRPEVWFVRAGTLDDPSTVAPDVHIYTRSTLPWVVLPGSVPAVEVYYDRHELWPRESLAQRRRPRLAGAASGAGRLKPEARAAR